jgi:aminoglycoside phosphotransferase (APT) family kinase protein
VIHVPDTQSVRRGEELDLAALTSYLHGKVAGIESGIIVTQFPKGHSNLTYLLRAGVHEYVLRRAPVGPVPPKAHDMAREYRILAAVHPHFPEAPRVFHLCEDPAVIGAVFFLMQRRHGFVLRESVPAEISLTPDDPRRISEAFIQCLVRLHAIDVTQTGLLSLGKPDGFLERQVEGWAARWQAAQTGQLEIMDAVIRWLRDQRPASGPPTLVHNDYKLDNVMLSFQKPDRVEAVLDWEMTTVGDPLADLGLSLCYWLIPPAITLEPGWHTRQQFIDRYAELSGRDLRHIGYHEVLGVFKLAVILQQIYYRFRRGQTSDTRFENFYERVNALAQTAARLIEHPA